MRTSAATAELQVRDGGILLLLDGAESSWIDLHDPTHLDFEYLQQMDAAVTALRGESGPVRAVHLGGAGCALARAWDATRPGSTQLAVEIDGVLARGEKGTAESTMVRALTDVVRSDLQAEGVA